MHQQLITHKKNLNFFVRISICCERRKSNFFFLLLLSELITTPTEPNTHSPVDWSINHSQELKSWLTDMKKKKIYLAKNNKI
jgi:hypothetical protein